MIRNLSKLLMALCLLTVGGGVVADAQIESAPPRIQANVAFAFVVGNTTLPAGKYEISRLDDTNPNTLELRSANGRTSVVFETEDAQTRDDQAASKTELVFDKVGDREFLSQIWVAGINSGRAVPKSRMEKRLDGGGSQAERHSIAAFLKHLKP